jgi:hypothetical protein
MQERQQRQQLPQPGYDWYAAMQAADKNQTDSMAHIWNGNALAHDIPPIPFTTCQYL